MAPTKAEGMNLKLIVLLVSIMGLFVGVAYAGMSFGLDAIQAASDAKKKAEAVQVQFDLHEATQIEQFKALNTRMNTLNDYHNRTNRSLEALSKGQRDTETKLIGIQATLDAGNNASTP